MTPRETTPWHRGAFRSAAPRLLFGYTYEDAAIELRAFRANSRVFCIAGAGETASALAGAGHTVTAVDINPRQVSYAAARAAGMAARSGAAERLLGFGRHLLSALGCTRRGRIEFLEMDDPGAQAAWYRRHLDRPLHRALIDTALSRRLLRLIYRGPFAAALPENFGAHLRARLLRGWSLHPNRTNPYAWRLLLGTALPDPRPPAAAFRCVCSDAAEYLESMPPAGFDGFGLSNIVDGAPLAYRRRLRRAVERAAAPGAVVVTRTFAPSCESADNHAAQDRSLLWGGVTVETL